MTTLHRALSVCCLMTNGLVACAAESGSGDAPLPEHAQAGGQVTAAAGAPASASIAPSEPVSVSTSAPVPPSASAIARPAASAPVSSASTARPSEPANMTATEPSAMPPTAASGVPSASPTVTLILEASELDKPSDIEFNPYVKDELWVMNFGDSSAVIISSTGSPQQSVLRRLDVEGARHFMPNPTAFAFGMRETTVVDAQKKPVEGTFATCPGVNQPFMGPTLWPSDLRIFGLAKSTREAPFNGPDTGLEGPGSHLDMLHSTPACTGIDWEGTGSIYWSYSGTDEMFVRYDFAKDHGIGNADHSDGSVWRYPVNGIRYVPNVPAHLAYARDSGLVYMADPGNGRVVRFDPKSATGSSRMNIADNLDGLRVAEDRAGGVLEELVPSSAGLKLPTGVALKNGALYISDYETSKVHKFSLDGMPLGEVEIKEASTNGGLTGLASGPDGRLYIADMKGNRIFRIDSDF